MHTTSLLTRSARRLQRAGWGLRKRRERLTAWLDYHYPGWRGKRQQAEPERGSRDLSGRFCSHPFEQIDLEESGACFTCCSAWLPTPMGNIRNLDVMAMWNGPTMQRIRESIYDGSFRYCRHDRCPVIQNDTLPTLAEAEQDPVLGEAVRARRLTLEDPPSFVNMVNDRSCNLYCPSCRTERINHNEGARYEKLAELQQRLLTAYLAAPNDRDFTLSITGSGDPFASRVYRELLYTLDGSRFPSMKIALQTNGVLLTPRNWARMEKIHANISSIIISFDAASPETYAVTRRGGHWATLLENCARMGELRALGEVRHLRYDFVVQKANFREMPDFVRLARSLGGDRAYFSRLVDWGTWPRDQFLEQCVWEQGHPLRDEFLAVLRDPALDDAFVDLGNVSDFYAEARR